MTWQEFIAEVARSTGTTKKRTREVLDAAFSRIGGDVKGGRRLVVPGFGIFYRRKRKARRTMVPHKDEWMRLPKLYSIGLRASKHQRWPAGTL